MSLPARLAYMYTKPHPITELKIPINDFWLRRVRFQPLGCLADECASASASPTASQPINSAVFYGLLMPSVDVNVVVSLLVL